MGGGPPQIPKGSPALLAAGLFLAGGAYIFSNSLFNVDGGQRAIKYRRLNGVSKEIYNEGRSADGKALRADGMQDAIFVCMRLGKADGPL